MDSKTKKLALIGAAVVAVGAGVTLALQAFNENLVFFFSPTQVAAKEAPTGRTFRLGGVVKPGSVKRQADSVTVTFGITDTAKIVPVSTRASSPTSSPKARASWPRASSTSRASSAPPKCSPSTTRTTCRPRLPRLSKTPTRRA